MVLTRLPAACFPRCYELQCLLLEKNRLTFLPPFVYTVLSLRVLALANNRLDSECIPDSLPLNAGSKLQALVLDGNNIGKLSGAVGLFSQLNVLSLSYNNVICHNQTSVSRPAATP